MTSIKSNIWKLYVMRALRWFLLIMPIIVLFFTQNGLTMSQVLILQALFSIAIIIFEIPSGYFSDVIGRKESIVLGAVFGFLGMLIYCFTGGFWGFLIAELLMGFGSSFVSGSDSALLYDSLKELKRTKDYKKTEGWLMSVGNFSEAIASLIGGALAVINIRYPFYLEAFLLLLIIPIAISLKEPKRKKHGNKEGTWTEIIKIVKYSMHHNGKVKWLILYSGFIGASTLTTVWFIQPYWELVNLPLFYFGVLWALLNASVGIFSIFAHKFEEIFGGKKSLISLIFISAFASIMLGIFKSLWAISFMILFYFVRGVAGPVFKDYVNQIISSDIRATVLSVKNLVVRLIFSIIGPIVGWVSDLYTLQYALISSGVIFSVAGVISMIFLKKNKAL